jgi:hypothetical protein
VTIAGWPRNEAAVQTGADDVTAWDDEEPPEDCLGGPLLRPDVAEVAGIRSPEFRSVTALRKSPWISRSDVQADLERLLLAAGQAAARRS